MTIYKRRSRHSKTILKGYQLYLMALDVECVDVNVAETEKLKKFHQCMQSGQSFYVAGKTLGIPEYISKKMWSMFCDWKSGKMISYSIDTSRETRPRIASAYELLLTGANENKMRTNGFTEFEIKKAIQFSLYSDADMLPVSISRKTDILVSTIKKLQKIHRSKIAEKATVTSKAFEGVEYYVQ
jgi:hypothetical protein